MIFDGHQTFPGDTPEAERVPFWTEAMAIAQNHTDPDFTLDPFETAVIIRDASETQGESCVARFVNGVKVFPFESA